MIKKDFQFASEEQNDMKPWQINHRNKFLLFWWSAYLTLNLDTSVELRLCLL